MTRRYEKGTPAQRFLARLEPTENGCLEYQGHRHSFGYGRFGVSSSETELAHRFAWRLAHGEIPAGMCVLHRCDNPPCANVEHLFLGTDADNSADMRAKGRGVGPPRIEGERHHRALLTAAQVAEIRSRYVPRVVTRRKLAQEYGVSESTIHAIVDGRNWRGTRRLCGV